VELIADESAGFSCCPNCGRVLEDIAFASDVQFAKGADGEGELVGQFVGEGGEARGMGRFSGGRLWGGAVRVAWGINKTKADQLHCPRTLNLLIN
jgi:transcription factor IIIB subunit 2